MTVKKITIGHLDYSVANIDGVEHLVHLDPRVQATKIVPKNRKKINALGEGHFTYGDVVIAAQELRGH